MRVRDILVAICWTMLVGSAGRAEAQTYSARLQRGGKVSFEPRGQGVLFGALDPTVKRWYIPEELYNQYRWRQGEYSNYAREPYQRYVRTALEGDYFYDSFGDFISRGFLVYDWRQVQPQEQGNSVFKSEQFTKWFNSVTVSGDRKGRDAYAITVGSSIRTILTPLTFSKPAFNGVKIDLVSDRYLATILASRISDPIPGAVSQPRSWTNATSTVGGRAEIQVGDFITVGGTVVDGRNTHTALDMFSGNFVAGNLTAGQSSIPVTAIAVILSDDSPEDGQGGAALFSHDIRITTRNFETDTETVWTLEDVVRPGTEWPVRFGGFDRGAFLAADGDERIVLNYDFTDPAFRFPVEGLEETNIVKVEFDYVLANDYKIDMWSNRQTGKRAVPSPPLTAALIDREQPALIPVRRAGGNVANISNIRRVRFDYGLPTANMVAGFTVEGTDVWGVDFYGEWDRNFRYSQYPNAALFTAGEAHEISRQTADARYLTVARQEYPYFMYGEAYSLDEDYSTSTFVVDGNGNVKYDNLTLDVYEFVEDNDDQDSLPDWVRTGSGGADLLVFPGWDDNNDFISDFNQNDNSAVPNTQPDYEEPFLRYDVERPEFLFGIDLNNNDYVDRFEDDELPDYPYKADRRGYNAFVGMHFTPETRVTVGRTDERMLSDERDNTTTYGLFTFDREYPGLGRVRVFDMLKRAEDAIPDDRRAPSPYVGAPAPPLVEDILPAQDTWINTAWLELDHTAIQRLKVIGKLKYQFYHQTRDDPRDLSNRPMTGTPSLFALVNKVEYRLSLGALSLRPRLKSEYFRQDSFILEEHRAGDEEDEREHWMGTATLIAQFPFLTGSSMTAGVELAQFSERVSDEDELLRLGKEGETGDERSVNLAVQLSNRSSYLGYRLTTHIGLRLARVFTERVRESDPGEFEKVSKGTTETTSFITIFAGLQ